MSSVIWIMGLSGAGKSTVAGALKENIDFVKTVILDGDIMRAGLNSDLGYSRCDREENVRRVAEVAKIISGLGVVCIVACMTPLERFRVLARKIIGDDYIEVFMDTPLAICRGRDVKGLYDKAEKGVIRDFSGVDAPFEDCENCDVIIKNLSVDEAVDKIIKKLNAR